MNRKETTSFLSHLLISDRLTGMGKHWASEVSLDHWSKDAARVDFMQFEPSTQTSVSGIEKGIFTCYEVKSCKADFNSGYGKNFIAEKNYFVMPMSLYKEVSKEIPHNVGVSVPIPRRCDKDDRYDEFEKPTELSGAVGNWKLWAIKPAHLQERKKPMVELLFCMLRSGKGWWNVDE